MLPPPDTALGRLLARLRDWISLAEFEAALADYFHGTRSAQELANYRAKRGTVKKLRDEVAPVLHHVKFVEAKGEVRFALDDGVPDCWLRESPGAPPQGIEVTVALSREQYRLGQEMNERRIVPGFLGLPDDTPEKVFKERLARGRVMHSSEGALKAVSNGIKDCLRKKDRPKYAGHDLLIEAHLHSLPKERWSRIEDDLRSAASTLPFREIHVIGDHDTSPFGFRIK